MAQARLHWRLLAPLLIVVLLTQTVLPLSRLGLIYLAIGANYDSATVAMVSACYSLIPIFLTVWIGRHNDRGGHRSASIGGALCVGAALAAGVLCPPTIVTLVVSNSILGIGQTLLINSSQTMLNYAAPAEGRDSTVGHYMVVASIGHVVGPLLIAVLAGETLDAILVLEVGLAGFLALLAATIALALASGRHARAAKATPPTAIALLANKNLLWIVICSAACMGSTDMILIFLPILGSERGIDPAIIGTLLAIRSACALPTRLFFGALIRWLGRRNLLLIAMLVGAAGFVLVAAPLPLWALALVVAVSGVGMGLAMPTTLALTFAAAPEGAIGMATSLRTTLARIVQFGGPVAAGIVASASGAGGVFIVVGGVLAVSGVGTFRALRGP